MNRKIGNGEILIKTLTYDGETYPDFQRHGFASKFIFPFAKEVCIGRGYDIGCNKEEWKLPGAIGIDLTYPDDWNAFHLPDEEVDYIFSSHCLEHLDSWVNAIEYWTKKLKAGGVLFLYLPDYSQKYWRPWNNRKHLHIIDRLTVKDLLIGLGYKNIFVSGVDLNNSYAIMGEKNGNN